MKKPEPQPVEPSGLDHQPLPYIVTVRMTADEDTLPQEITSQQLAYSVLEACVQAITAARAAAGLLQANYIVTMVAPDVPTWAVRLIMNKAMLRIAATQMEQAAAKQEEEGNGKTAHGGG